MLRIKSLNDQRGAISLITVILLMFIFLVVTLGFLRLAISEQRASIDTDLNSRAYYAAESGIEDARRIINRYYSDGSFSDDELNNLGNATCAGPTQGVISIELDTEITCQIIDLSPGEFVASLNVNESIFLPLLPATGNPSDVATIKIEWHERVSDGSVVSRSSLNTTIPQADCWNTGEGGSCTGDQYAAMLRTGLFRHSESGAIQRSSINNKISYLNPVNGDGFVDSSAFENKSSNVNLLSNEPNCVEDSSVDYFCRLEINVTNPGANYLRITPIYKGTTLRVTMLDSDGNALEFKNTQAKIDVTGQAGDVIRRIETRIPLRPYDVLPDEAITTAEELCKLISITSSDSAQDSCED